MRCSDIGRAVWKGWVASIAMASVVLVIERFFRFDPCLLPVYVLSGGVLYAMFLRVLRAVDGEDVRLVRGLLGDRLSPLAGLLEKFLT